MHNLFSWESYQNHVSSLLGKTQDSYYKQYFEDNRKNLRLVWKTIKGTINMKKESEESISSLLINGEIISSAKEISNYFNNFFTSVAEKINKNIVKSKKNTYPTLALRTITQSSFLQIYQRTLKV